MTDFALRPLSLGEILDRAFSLYRSNFLLFVGISGISQLLILAVTLPTTLLSVSLTTGMTLITLFVTVVISLVAYLFSQGGTILAVSQLYLGRPTSIGESLRRVWEEFGSLFGVTILVGLAVLGGFILFVIPGIYVACRLLVSLPSALIENRGPRESLSRSFGLTRDYAGRAFVILLFSAVLTYAATALFAMPFAIGVATAANDPEMLRIWQALTRVGSSVGAILVGPIPLIANSVFYYDLRVRKEAFDLQFMMNPDSQRPPNPSGIPSILS